MTNYERIQRDKAFCASVISVDEEYTSFEDTMRWLDQEQHELTDETEATHDQRRLRAGTQGGRMNEIERAIAYWEEFEREIDEMPYSDVLEAQREPVKTALAVLRAELSRQENAPMTCDGCKWHPIKYDFLGCIISRCENCCRQTVLTDRYEPKGENQ